MRHPGTWSMAKRLICAATLLAGAAAQAEEPPALPPAARCAELYRLYWQYVGDWVFYADGNRPAVELGNYHCQQGRLEEGSRALEAILRRNKMPVPRELPADSARNGQAESPRP